MESVAISARQTLSRDLSKAPSMALGPLTILPSTRTVTSGAESRLLEPRVIRTLIVLAEASGEVLSRDDLIELAWDGVIVGDNAINRVISQLRKVLADLVGNAVRLETITKVGFRLLTEDAGSDRPAPQEAAAAPQSGLRRRAVLGAGLAVAAGGVVYGGWRWLRGHVPDPRARDLWERGQIIQKTGEPGTIETAMGFYKQAVAIDPEYADAWGALAIVYRHSVSGYSRRKAEAYEALSRSAASRALELDPNQPDADAVGVMFRPRFGRLAAAERDLRGLVARHPEYWYGLGQLGILLRDGGRIRESLGMTRKQVSLDPMLPVGWANLANAEAFAGNLQQADQAIAQGLSRFPTNLAMWAGHFGMLLHSSRFSEAAAVARDVRERPEYIPADVVDFYGGLADVLSAPSRAATAQWRDRILAVLADDVSEVDPLAAALFQLGLREEGFTALERYFAAVRQPDFPIFTASTQMLFSPLVLRHADDPRFAALLESTGLEAYWKETGSRPDFRRG